MPSSRMDTLHTGRLPTNTGTHVRAMTPFVSESEVVLGKRLVIPPLETHRAQLSCTITGQPWNSPASEPYLTGAIPELKIAAKWQIAELAQALALGHEAICCHCVSIIPLQPSTATSSVL